MIKLIVAIDLEGGVGSGGHLPWGNNLPKDLQVFKNKTLHSTVLMGKNTFQSLPFKNGLPDRQNYVLSSVPKKSYLSGHVVWFTAIDKVMDCQNLLGTDDDIWIIGGASIYKQLEHLADEIHVTEVLESYPEADTFYKPNLDGFEEDHTQTVDVSSENLQAISKVYIRKN